MKTTNDFKIENLDIDIKEVFKTIFQYKWSTLIITLSVLFITSLFLYFKAPHYISSALIEVKTDTKQNIQQEDFLRSAFSNFGNEKLDKEIEILKTFHINNHALSTLDFEVQYFVYEWFKKVELYHKSPIEVKNIKIIYQDDLNIIGTVIKLTPVKNGYQLQVKNSFLKKILYFLLNKEIIELDDEKVYHYGDRVESEYFEFTIEQKMTVDEPIYFVLKGDNRQIFEGMINKNLQVNQPNPSAPLIQITYKDTIHRRANAYVDALSKSFILQSVTDKSRQTNQIIDFINKQLSDMKTKLDESEEKLERYRIEYQAIDPSLQAETFITELSRIEVQLSQNKLNEEIMENLLPFVQKGKNIDAIAPSLMEMNDQSTLELITRLQEAQIREEGLRIEYSGRHPGLVAVRKQIKHIKNKILLSIENLKSSMTHRNKNLQKLKALYEKNLESLPTQERTLINLKRDYQVSSETYNYLLKKKSENEMLKVAILSDYRIVDHAYSNGKPIGIKTPILLLIALLSGIILGILQALVRNLMNDKIQTRHDIENLTTLPIYGILPTLNQKALKLEVFKDQRSPFTESYRSLRTNLQFARKENQANVILVTSTVSGEGKSTIVANLGAIFQMANIKSIVVNLDLRKPTLHHYFNVSNSTGISTYLSGRNRIGEIIQSTEYKNLDIISSGPIPPNPSELILTHKLDELIEALKEEYDYIFIDSAPLGLVTDTMHLMQYADISLIVFRENYAKKSFVTDLNDLVTKHDLKHIGLVINSVDASSGAYGYGYGYGYGNK
ncbi:polysaccharide biosynthesis tyrosine autokinase [Sulfurovum sp. XGS-02]|uniref:GumC family protein n=1 Tax=Sulfurovum sp. XGS-02 TaxID=2925411 RepID=UPI00205A3FC2|nr:tyrosine-protein kinase [Sulfurovum sp. XGS-02]UPT76802.1 polysaccharide biosynthesis tyrosine autokinase [Sulfurovum sp. XGS-02]